MCGSAADVSTFVQCVMMSVKGQARCQAPRAGTRLRWCEPRTDKACGLVKQWPPNKLCARREIPAREVEVNAAAAPRMGGWGYQGRLLRGNGNGARSLLICSPLSVTESPVPNLVKCSLVKRQSVALRN